VKNGVQASEEATMARQRGFRVLVATDGSPSARAAVAVATAFPWPRGADVHGVIARRLEAATQTPRRLLPALDREGMRIAAGARRALARRWPAPDVVLVNKAPVAAILDETRRLDASVVVVGWRGHGGLRRLLFGSVSRGVVRQAACPVLVVRRRPRDLGSFVIGLDGSVNAQRAARFLARLPPPRSGRVTVVRVEEPVALATRGTLPGTVRSMVHRELAALNRERRARATREVAKVAANLARRGWTVRRIVRSGTPLDELLDVVKATRPGALVVGARGVGGLRRLLLGSVAEGALNHSPVPVLVVR
jgi:nucleotide-binding universal stress UspA family protein